jgi:predicted transposase YdaD
MTEKKALSELDRKILKALNNPKGDGTLTSRSEEKTEMTDEEREIEKWKGFIKAKITPHIDHDSIMGAVNRIETTARQQGIIQGRAEENKEWLSIVKQIKKDFYADGKSEGIKIGEKSGYEKGLIAGQKGRRTRQSGEKYANTETRKKGLCGKGRAALLRESH